MKRGKVFLVMEKKKNDARRRRLSLSLARVKTARKKKGGRLHPREARVPQLPPPLKKVRESGKKNWTENLPRLLRRAPAQRRRLPLARLRPLIFSTRDF